MISVTVQQYLRRVKTWPGFFARNSGNGQYHTEKIERRTFRLFGIPFFATERIVATNF
jgi:hypothetical protein